MLRGAIIGCGFFARIQMEAWIRVEGAQMAAACDLDQSKAQAFAQDFALEAYMDVGRMLEEQRLDFVDIATRPSTHVALARQIASRGLPILCQKPMAERWEQAEQLVQAARDAGVRLMINENWRWQAWYRFLHRQIEEGAIGRPFGYSIQTRNRDGLGDSPYANQPYFKSMPRLLVFETLVHHLDTARFLFGDIDEVYCRTRRLNPAIAGEDAAWILVRHARGFEGVIDGNRASPPDQPGPAMEIARFEGFDGVLRLTHRGDVWLGAERLFEGTDLPGYRGDSCRATQQHFVDCLASGAEFETEGAEYLNRTFAAVEACYRSAAENRPVRLAEITGQGLRTNSTTPNRSGS